MWIDCQLFENDAIWIKNRTLQKGVGTQARAGATHSYVF